MSEGEAVAKRGWGEEWRLQPRPLRRPPARTGGKGKNGPLGLSMVWLHMASGNVRERRALRKAGGRRVSRRRLRDTCREKPRMCLKYFAQSSLLWRI